MQKQQMVYLPLKDIKPYENNPRKNDDAVDKVAASLSAFGPQSPIIVDRNRVIIAGHTRYKAAKSSAGMSFHAWLPKASRTNRRRLIALPTTRPANLPIGTMRSSTKSLRVS